MHKSEALVCQSCSLIMEAPEQYGTEADGSRTQEYCIHCYKGGQFTRPAATLDDMVDFYAPNWGAWTGNPGMSLEQAKAEVRAILSKLKRWKDQA